MDWIHQKYFATQAHSVVLAAIAQATQQAQSDFSGIPFDKLMKNIEIIGTDILSAIKKYTAKNQRHT